MCSFVTPTAALHPKTRSALVSLTVSADSFIVGRLTTASCLAHTLIHPIPPCAMARKERFSRIGDYVLKETLGSGSFGKVKLAVNETTGKHYACKIIEKDIVKERTLLNQVQKEIHIMRNLQHRNTVSLVAVLASASKIFIVMELVTGGELFDEIRRNRRLTEPYARFYFRQLIDGLQYCHDHGVYHRDLKPENLLLDENHTLKITDFGLSYLKAQNNSLTTSLTKSGLLHTQCGTPNYVAPEIITLDATGYSGARVDAWSCGIILYVLVAGSLPFDEPQMEGLFRSIVRGSVDFPHFFSEDLRDLISNLLKTSPKERYRLADVRRHPWFTNPEIAYTNHLPGYEDPASMYPLPNRPLPNTSSSHRRSFAMRSHGNPPQPAPEPNFIESTVTIGPAPPSRSGTSSAADSAAPIRQTDSIDMGINAKVVASELSISTRNESSTFQGDTNVAADTTTHSINDAVAQPDVAYEHTPTTLDPYAQTGNQQEANINSSLPPPSYDTPATPNHTDYSDHHTAGYYDGPTTDDDGDIDVDRDDDGDDDDDDDFSHEEAQTLHLTGRPYRALSSLRRNPSASSFGQRRVMSTNDLTKEADAIGPQPGHSDSHIKFDDDYNNVRNSSTTLGDVQRQMWNRDANIWRPQWDAYSFDNRSTDTAAVDALRIEKMADDVDRAFRSKGKMASLDSASGGGAGTRMRTDTTAGGSSSYKPGGIRKTKSIAGVHSLMKRSMCSSLDDVEKDTVDDRQGQFGQYALKRSFSHDGRLTVHPPRRTRQKSKRKLSENKTDGSGNVSRTTGSQKQRKKSGHPTDQSTNSTAAVASSEKRTKRSRGSSRGRGPLPSGRRTQPKDVQTKRLVDTTPEADHDWMQGASASMVWTSFMRDYDMIPDEVEFGYNSKQLNDMWEKAMEEAGLVKEGQFWEYISKGNTWLESRSSFYLSNLPDISDEMNYDQWHGQHHSHHPESLKHKSRTRTSHKTVNFVDDPPLPKQYGHGAQHSSEHAPLHSASTKPRRNKNGKKKATVRFAPRSSQTDVARPKSRTKRTVNNSSQYDNSSDGLVDSSIPSSATLGNKRNALQDTVMSAHALDNDESLNQSASMFDPSAGEGDTTIGRDIYTQHSDGGLAMDQGNISDVTSGVLSPSSPATVKSHSHAHGYAHSRSTESPRSLTPSSLRPITPVSDYDLDHHKAAVMESSDRDDASSHGDDDHSEQGQVDRTSSSYSQSTHSQTHSTKGMYPSRRSVRGAGNIPSHSKDIVPETTDMSTHSNKGMSMPLAGVSKEGMVAVDKSPSSQNDRKTRDIKENDRHNNNNSNSNDNNNNNNNGMQLHLQALGDITHLDNTMHSSGMIPPPPTAPTTPTALRNSARDGQYEAMTRSQTVSPFTLDIPAPKGLTPPSQRLPSCIIDRVPTVVNFVRKDLGVLLSGRDGYCFQSLLYPADSYEVMNDALKAYGCNTRRIRGLGDCWKIRCEWTGSKGQSRRAKVIMRRVDPDGLSVVYVVMHPSFAGHEEEFQSFYDSVRKKYYERTRNYQRRRKIGASNSTTDLLQPRSGSEARSVVSHAFANARVALLSRRNKRKQWMSSRGDPRAIVDDMDDIIDDDDDARTEAPSSTMHSSSGMRTLSQGANTGRSTVMGRLGYHLGFGGGYSSVRSGNGGGGGDGPHTESHSDEDDLFDT